jgi:tetrapyrrole methylase family protein/MazG family protein
VADAEGVLRNWERRKAEEAATAGRVAETPLDRVPESLPALAWTFNMQKRAARVGFDPDDRQSAGRAVVDRAQELAAGRGPGPDAFDAVGELLLAAVSLARTQKVNPEDALRAAGQRYRDRFAAMHRKMRTRGAGYHELSAGELADLWDRTEA